MAIFTAHHNLGGVGAVDPDAQDKQVQNLGRNQVRLWHIFVEATCDVGLHHGHAVHGQGAGLVGTDGRGVAHRLAGIQVANQVVVLHHFLKRDKMHVCLLLVSLRPKDHMTTCPLGSLIAMDVINKSIYINRITFTE